MSRIIIFGCSYTQYGWPTWANILGYDMEIEYHNFALPGLGNVGIMHRMVEANAKLKFNKDDKIFILWSSWSREDRIRNSNWVCTGSVFNGGNTEYNRYFIKRYWSYDNDIVKNSTAIIAANKMFGEYITWQGSAFKLAKNEAFKTKKTSSEITKFYLDQLPEIPYYNFERSEFQKPFDVIQDCHPDIIQHMQILQEFIYPAIDKQLQQSTVDIFSSLHNDALEKIKVTLKPDIPKAISIINNIIDYKYQDIRKNSHNHYTITDAPG
jgi:hypothetical protein